jgi:integrase
MSERRDQVAAARALGQAGFEADRLATLLVADVDRWRLPKTYLSSMRRAIGLLAGTLQGLPGERLVDRWTAFEQQVWPQWTAGKDRPPLGALWTWGVWAAVCSRAVQPGWPVLSIARVSQWVAKLPADDPLVVSTQRLREVIDGLRWGSTAYRAAAVTTGTKLLLASGRDDLEDLTDGDMRSLPRAIGGADILDMALCALGIFDRTPLRGTTRHGRTRRLSPAEMVAGSDIAADFQPVTTLYLQTYARRISDRYATLQHKLTSIGHFWRYLREQHPDVACCARVTPAHARGFVPYAIERARTVRRGARISADGDDRLTAHAWLVDVRTFFADICTWGTEPDSPFTGHVPAVVPLTRHDLLDVGFKQARQRREAHVTSLVLDLQREIPNIRAFALRRWHEAQQAAANPAGDRTAQAAEVTAFWDWALLVLLLASGLRVEEACELTTFDILKRQLTDGRVYYLLHIKPSKFDRARVIPIGDQLGRVIAEIIRHVRAFYGAAAVPACDRRDIHEKTPLPRAPYLLQGAGHPSVIGVNTIRGRLRQLSTAAQARRADGSPLVLEPHDCRRAFASEHLNNNTPVHVIAALLGHATLDTVMVYAKLYPTTLVELYRQAMRGIYTDVHGVEALRAPTVEEWAAFSANCSMRDMGTHLCALPTGEHCPKGLVCLGCNHAQPKKSAAPTFRRMLASHTRALSRAHEIGEPAGQIAARQSEIERIRSALRRAEELSSDVAAAIESAAI